MDVQLLTPLIVIILLFVLATFLQRFSVPPIITQIIALIGLLATPLNITTFELPIWTLEALLFILLFYVSVQTPPSEFGKEALRAIPASIATSIVGIAVGFSVSHFYLALPLHQSAVIAFIMGAFASASLLTTMERCSLIKTEVAKAGVGIAIVNNLIALLALSAVHNSHEIVDVALKSGYALGWLILAIATARYIYPRIVKALNITSTEATLSALLLQALFLSFVAHLLGLSFMLGAFVSALFVKETYLHGEIHVQIRKSFFALSYLIALPLLLLSSTQFLKLDLSVALSAIILVVTVGIAQFIVTYASLWFKHYGRAQSTALASFSFLRSEVAFALALFAVHMSLISAETFSLILLALLIATLLSFLSLFIGFSKLKTEEPYRSIIANKGSK